jgi:hypothetical protein
MEEAKQLAETFGGKLDVPRLRRKYAWIEIFGGRRAAARAEEVLPNFKMTLARWWDKVMYQFERAEKA